MNNYSRSDRHLSSRKNCNKNYRDYKKYKFRNDININCKTTYVYDPYKCVKSALRAIARNEAIFVLNGSNLDHVLLPFYRGSLGTEILSFLKQHENIAINMLREGQKNKEFRVIER